MAEDIQLGRAFVQIVPSAKGIEGAISKELNGEAESAGKTGGGHLIKSMGKAIAAGSAAIATAAAALVTQSVKQFSEYEQLAGGAELMFGDAYDFVAEKAQNAYKTVQMSQSEYLNQANGFAVGLTNALGGNAQAAAELADKILTAEADIVAATGRDAEAIQNAFNGIMRGNFTMLDNLGLGIAGTRAGMEQVIEAVNAQKEANGEATRYQMDNLADMQAALVDYVKMQGLAGYASMEASKTITGSLASTKAAWSNVLVAMANDNADLEGSVDALAESASSFAANLIPRISAALKALPILIKELAPVIIGQLPGLITELLPAVVQMAVDLVISIATALPGLISTLIPVVIDSVLLIIRTLLPQIPQILEMLIPAVIEGAVLLVNSIIDMLPELITMIVQVLIESAPIILDGIWQLILGILDVLKNLGVMIYDYVLKPLWDSISEWFSGLGSKAAEGASNFIQNVVTFFRELPGKIGEFLGTVIGTVVRWAIEFQQKAYNAAAEFVANIVGFLRELPGKILAFLSQAVGYVIKWAQEFPAKAKTAAVNMFNAVVNTVKELPGKIKDIGLQVVQGLWKGISGAGDWLRRQISSFVSGILGGFKKGFNTNSPSKETEWIGKMVDLGLAKGIEENADSVSSAINDIVGMTTGTLTSEVAVVGSMDYSGMPNSAVESPMGQLITAVDRISRRLDRMQVVLDSGELVGGIAERMDSELGSMQMQTKRGLLA